MGRYKNLREGKKNFNTHCGISRPSLITVLTSLLFHKKFTWPHFGRVLYTPVATPQQIGFIIQTNVASVKPRYALTATFPFRYAST